MVKHTKEERNLLAKLAEGLFDGAVGNEKVYHGYKDVTCGKYIKDGEPVSYREGESTRFFNGRGNETIPGKRTEEHFKTDDEKLGFLKKFGWLINDDDARAYSAKFKPVK